MSDHRQRQRHGATKALVEGAGGLIVGSALVLLARQLLGTRRAAAARDQVAASERSARATPRQAPSEDHP